MTATVRTIDADMIPVVDIGPLRDGSNPKAVARALHAASKGLGFIYIRGHGVPDDVIEKARSAAFGFFRAPVADKETVRVSPRHRGWIAQGGAKMDDDAIADLKESFLWGVPGRRGSHTRRPPVARGEPVAGF